MSSKSSHSKSSKKDSSSSETKHSKSKSSKKHTSSKNTKEIAAATVAVLKLVNSKPRHYTSRRVVSKLSDKFNPEITRAAIANLQGLEKIDFDRKDGGRGEKGSFVMFSLSKRAA